MNINLNPVRISEMLKDWKDSVDLRVPMDYKFKLHFISQRRAILSNLEQITSSWLLFIGTMTCDSNSEDFLAMRNEIKSFNAWALDEIKAVDQLQVE